MITPYEQSAIIGLWRQGNKPETIMWALGIEYFFVEKTISDYIKLLTYKK